MEHRFRLLYGAQDIAGLQYIAYLCRRLEIPEPFVVYGVHPDTSRYPVPGQLLNFIERALNAVVYGFYKSGGKLYRQGSAGGFHRLPGAYAAGLLVYLYGGLIPAKLYYFAYQLLFGYADHVVHVYVRHAGSHYQGA